VQEPKHGLGDVKPVIRLKRIRCRGEHRKVRHQEVGVGLQHLLVVWLTVSSVHEVLCQHSHELILHG
jgi:hypothetical protein